MRVLERSHGLRRSVSGTLRPREAPQKPRRRPYVVAAFILVVFGAATHVYIDYEAVHAGEVPTDAPKEEKAILKAMGVETAGWDDDDEDFGDLDLIPNIKFG